MRLSLRIYSFRLSTRMPPDCTGEICTHPQPHTGAHCCRCPRRKNVHTKPPLIRVLVSRDVSAALAPPRSHGGRKEVANFRILNQRDGGRKSCCPRLPVTSVAPKYEPHPSPSTTGRRWMAGIHPPHWECSDGKLAADGQCWPAVETALLVME